MGKTRNKRDKWMEDENKQDSRKSKIEEKKKRKEAR